VGEKGRNYSFPSNHAANMAGLATVFSSIYYRYRTIFWVTAGIVMFSRVYIGVHYPSDVITGCILGCVYGLLVLKGWNFYQTRSSNQI
jgi:undecaprenyl-diphosphatase